ncbi:thiamine-monophosphate kinase [Parvibaculum lavamentivorans DS-1]|uniref:Thiamine-monophosphate kinase n=1 Tax=Parvibaculum lavamentivorans (strain DS-1 / DSM 13023 / NCIMB 13966) TaxID=402881 RepID=A7HX89_PARL1|nr:thiamine-phosphate kinase [Parvibaculum lavamentivorans]ABS64522.1 thiamine-monophosphate kinase [Parvibaculum lavamentivorans DS-1]
MAARSKPEGGNGGRPSEFALIEDLFAPLAAGAPGAYGLKDDAALFSPSPDHETVLTVDAMVAGVHFLPDDPPETVARKLLRVNLSDLAAKGATPRGYLLVTAWRAETSVDWMRGFAAGLMEDQNLFGISLWGGDTVTTTGPMTLSLTAIGEVAAGQMIRRGGARPGDDIYVTGTVGDAALGLSVLRGALDMPDTADAAHLVRRYREPEPRTAFGPKLCGVAHAALDVSDGLMADLGHICEVSGTGARINMESVPLSRAARAALARDPRLVEAVAGGGDDYEILFAAPPDRASKIGAIAAESGISATRIGTMTEQSDGVSAIDGAGNKIALKQLGYRHF